MNLNRHIKDLFNGSISRGLKEWNRRSQQPFPLHDTSPYVLKHLPDCRVSQTTATSSQTNRFDSPLEQRHAICSLHSTRWKILNHRRVHTVSPRRSTESNRIEHNNCRGKLGCTVQPVDFEEKKKNWERKREKNSRSPRSLHGRLRIVARDTELAAGWHNCERVASNSSRHSAISALSRCGIRGRATGFMRPLRHLCNREYAATPRTRSSAFQ